MKKITPNRIILINAVCQGLLSGISALMMPVYSYLLGTAGYGLASVYTTWISILSVIIGFRAFYAIGVASKDFEEKEQLEFQANGVYFGFVISIVAMFLVMLSAKTLANLLTLPQWSIYLLCPHAFGVFSIQVLNWKFTYEFKQEKNLIVSVAMSIGTALISVVAILLLPIEQRVLGKIIGTAIPQIFCGFLLLVFFWKRVGRCFRSKYINYMLRYSFPLMLSDLCVTLFSGSDKLMLQKMISDSEAGIYSLAFNFAGMIFSIEYMLNHAWLPLYFQYEADENRLNLQMHIKRYIRLFSILSIGFLLLSPEVFLFFSAPEFWPGKKLIPIFVIGCYLYFMEVFALNFKSFHKETKTTAIVMIVSSVCNLALNVILIPHFGSAGAAFATLLGYFVALVGNWRTLKYSSQNDRVFPCNLKMFFPYWLTIVFATLLFYLPGTWMVRWLSGILLGTWLLKSLFKEKQIF